MSEPMLISVREAAQRLGLGRDSTYQLVREGRLAHLKIGRRVRIPVVALERWIEDELSNGEAKTG